jgi:hypothetical protein
MAGDAASNAATKVKPSEEALATIDQPAQDNTWHDTPDLSKDNLRAQAQQIYKSRPAQDAQDVASAGASAAQQSDGGVNVDAGKDIAAQKAQEKISPETEESVKQSAAAYRARARQYLGNKVPKERREQTIWRLKVQFLCPQKSDWPY